MAVWLGAATGAGSPGPLPPADPHERSSSPLFSCPLFFPPFFPLPLSLPPFFPLPPSLPLPLPFASRRA